MKGKSEPLAAYRLLAVKEGAPALARRLDLPLVGRERELSQLTELLSEVERKRTLMIALVVGEAGVGKSRLVNELLARRDPVRSFTGRCLHYGDGITFWPIAEIVRTAGQIDDADTPAAALAKLERLLAGKEAPALAQAIGVAIGLAEAEVPIEEVFVSIRALFETLADRNPLVLVFDDLHWAEETLLELVEYLVRASAGAPILLLVLARPELLERQKRWADDYACLRLAPLGAAESGRLAVELLGAPLEADLSDRLAEASQGNPLYVEEMLRMLADEGALERREGIWVAAGELAGIDAPPSIEALIAARLERLGAPERAVAEAASVAGQVFWADAIAEVAERQAVAPELETLLKEEIVLDDAERFRGHAAYRFAHILVRDAAYERLLKETRADLPRTLRPLARAHGRRPPCRIRGDRRLPPRARLPLPRGAGSARRACPGARRAGRYPPWRRRRTRVRARGHRWRDHPARPGPVAAANGRSRPSGADGRPRHGADRCR